MRRQPHQRLELTFRRLLPDEAAAVARVCGGSAPAWVPDPITRCLLCRAEREPDGGGLCPGCRQAIDGES